MGGNYPSYFCPSLYLMSRNENNNLILIFLKDLIPGFLYKKKKEKNAFFSLSSCESPGDEVTVNPIIGTASLNSFIAHEP